MILTCPACTMRYLVAEGAVGPHGRRVRCAHCGHQWRQAAEEGLDEALFNEDDGFAPTDSAAFNIDFSDDEVVSALNAELDDEDDTAGSDFQSILRKELAETPIPEGVKPLHEEHDPVLASLLKSKANDAPKKRSRLGGFVVAGTIYLLILAAFFALHEPIGRAWPPANLLYNLAGLPPAVPGEGLALEDLAAEMHDDRIVMKGIIINLKSADMKVPAIMATIVDANAKPLDRILIAPPVARLKAEGRVAFDAAYPSVPDGAANVTYAFTYVKAEPAPPKPDTQEPAKEKAEAHGEESPSAAEHAPADHPPAHE